MRIEQYGIKYADGRVALGQRLFVGSDDTPVGAVELPDGAEEISYEEAVDTRARLADDTPPPKTAKKKGT